MAELSTEPSSASADKNMARTSSCSIWREKKNRKKSSNAENTGPPLNAKEDPSRCHAFMERKQRFCRQRCNRGSRYCGNHLHLEVESTPQQQEEQPKETKRKRIPCPIDPSHTIFADNVDKHIEICPKTKQQRLEKQQPFYRCNVNTGGHGDMRKSSKRPSNGDSGERQHEETLEWAKRLAWRILYAHQAIFSSSFAADATENSLQNNAEPSTIKSYLASLTSKDIEDSIPLQDLSERELDAGLAHSIESYTIRTGGRKHLQQQASLIGHLRRIHLLPELPPTDDDHTQKCQQKENKRNDNNVAKIDASSKTILLELGAGRGMMGLLAAGVFGAARVPNVNLFMVERCGTRSKAETVLRTHFHDAHWKKAAENRRSECLDLDAVQGWTRIQADLSHVHMPTVLEKHPQQQQGQEQNGSVDLNNGSGQRRANHMESVSDGSLRDATIIALAKHLCGAGTDLALKSLLPIKDQVSACIMATCCHGLCTWKDYVGRDFLSIGILKTASSVEEGVEGQSPFEFGEDEFELMRIWSSGTVKDDDHSQCKSCTTDVSVDDEDGESGHFFRDRTYRAASKTRSQIGVGAVVDALHFSSGVRGLGRACQRLIDHGRREWLLHVLFENGGDCQENVTAELCYYVPSSVTPQNAALIASRKSNWSLL